MQARRDRGELERHLCSLDMQVDDLDSRVSVARRRVLQETWEGTLQVTLEQEGTLQVASSET